MYVLAKRIVGSWKCGVKINSQTGEGYYVWNAPEGNDPDPDEWGPDNPEPADSTTVSEQDSTQNASVRTRAKSVAGVEQATDVFRIIPGFYKFITLNLDTMEFVYSDINDYMLTDESRTTLRDLCVEYKRFLKGHGYLKEGAHYFKNGICVRDVVLENAGLDDEGNFRILDAKVLCGDFYM
jgi:hypothetical protein